MSAAPKLEITGNESPDFIFREDFSPIMSTSMEINQVSGELVWVENYDALEFGDALADTIVVRANTTEIDFEIEQAVNYGAVGIIFVGDALSGNDAVEQAKRFNEVVGIDGVILTKVDTDAKGGSSLSIAYTIGKPLLFIGVGQEYDDNIPFDAEWMVKNLFGE